MAAKIHYVVYFRYRLGLCVTFTYYFVVIFLQLVDFLQKSQNTLIQRIYLIDSSVFICFTFWNLFIYLLYIIRIDDSSSTDILTLVSLFDISIYKSLIDLSNVPQASNPPLYFVCMLLLLYDMFFYLCVILLVSALPLFFTCLLRLCDQYHYVQITCSYLVTKSKIKYYLTTPIIMCVCVVNVFYSFFTYGLCFYSLVFQIYVIANTFLIYCEIYIALHSEQYILFFSTFIFSVSHFWGSNVDLKKMVQICSWFLKMSVVFEYDHIDRYTLFYIECVYSTLLYSCSVYVFSTTTLSYMYFLKIQYDLIYSTWVKRPSLGINFLFITFVIRHVFHDKYVIVCLFLIYIYMLYSLFSIKYIILCFRVSRAYKACVYIPIFMFRILLYDKRLFTFRRGHLFNVRRYIVTVSSFFTVSCLFNDSCSVLLFCYTTCIVKNCVHM